MTLTFYYYMEISPYSDADTLSAGQHTLTLGGTNNKKTLDDEETEMMLTSLQVCLVMERTMAVWKGVLCTSRLLSVLVLAACGCTIQNPPGDLTFQAVQAVDYHDQRELLSAEESVFRSLVGDEALKRSGQLTYAEKPHEILLRVEFGSRLNLSKFSSENEYNVASMAYFCNRPNDRVRLSIPYVFWRDIIIRPTGQIVQGQDMTEAPIVYHFYTGVTQDESRRPSNPPLSSFNLLQNPEDICFELRGGNQDLGHRYVSNTVVVPRAAIAAALRNLPQGLGK